MVDKESTHQHYQDFLNQSESDLRAQLAVLAQTSLAEIEAITRINGILLAFNQLTLNKLQRLDPKNELENLDRDAYLSLLWYAAIKDFSEAVYEIASAVEDEGVNQQSLDAMRKSGFSEGAINRFIEKNRAEYQATQQQSIYMLLLDKLVERSFTTGLRQDQISEYKAHIRDLLSLFMSVIKKR